MLDIIYCGKGNQGQLCGEYVVYAASADDLGTDLVALVNGANLDLAPCSPIAVVVSLLKSH